MLKLKIEEKGDEDSFTFVLEGMPLYVFKHIFDETYRKKKVGYIETRRQFKNKNHE